MKYKFYQTYWFALLMLIFFPIIGVPLLIYVIALRQNSVPSESENISINTNTYTYEANKKSGCLGIFNCIIITLIISFVIVALTVNDPFEVTTPVVMPETITTVKSYMPTEINTSEVTTVIEITTENTTKFITSQPVHAKTLGITAKEFKSKLNNLFNTYELKYQLNLTDFGIDEYGYRSYLAHVTNTNINYTLIESVDTNQLVALILIGANDNSDDFYDLFLANEIASIMFTNPYNQSSAVEIIEKLTTDARSSTDLTATYTENNLSYTLGETELGLFLRIEVIE